MKLGQITGVLMAAAIVLSGITTTGVDAAEPCEDSSKCSTEQINDVDEGETGLEDITETLGISQASDDSENDGLRTSGWHQESNGKWRYYENNSPVIGWKKISGNWYYFDDPSGYMHTGWLSYHNNWYYFIPNASSSHYGQMVTGWKKITVSGVQHWYYFNAGGVMVKGWKTISNYTYFFNNDGEFVESTRRAIIITDKFDNDHTSDLDIDGWNGCLTNLAFRGNTVVTPHVLHAPSYAEFRNKLSTVMSGAEDSDITYLCITCQGLESGSIMLSPTTKIDGDNLRYELSKYNGKVILFLSFDYSGLVIQEEEGTGRSVNDNSRARASEEQFLSAFTDETRSGELLGDKFVVICACNEGETLVTHPYNEDPSMHYGCANRCWMTAGGYDPLYLGRLETMYADYNDDSIVTLDELSTYSDSNIPHQNQHVVVHSADEYFTIFARTYNAN